MELVQAWRTGRHYHHETEAYLLSCALYVAPESKFKLNDDMEMAEEMTEKLIVDAKFTRRGKPKRVSKLCTSSSEFLLNYKILRMFNNIKSMLGSLSLHEDN